MTKGKIYEYADSHNLFVEHEDKELFDEAKKEFPQLPVIHGFSTKEIVEIIDFWANANIWFVKWFGDEE
jgi:hypothetical protein